MTRFSDTVLSGYLDESLPADQLAAIEVALRDDPELRNRLQRVIRVQEAGVHQLGAIWRRNRLSCPDREEWAQFVLGVLDPEAERYLRFHLEEVGCRYCAANVDDLRESQRMQAADDVTQQRQRYFETSAGRLRQD